MGKRKRLTNEEISINNNFGDWYKVIHNLVEMQRRSDGTEYEVQEVNKITRKIAEAAMLYLEKFDTSYKEKGEA